jgi:hypothetical protein
MRLGPTNGASAISILVPATFTPLMKINPWRFEKIIAVRGAERRASEMKFYVPRTAHSQCARRRLRTARFDRFEGDRGHPSARAQGLMPSVITASPLKS